jgi:hypothetical protein
VFVVQSVSFWTAHFSNIDLSILPFILAHQTASIFIIIIIIIIIIIMGVIMMVIITAIIEIITIIIIIILFTSIMQAVVQVEIEAESEMVQAMVLELVPPALIFAEVTEVEVAAVVAMLDWTTDLTVTWLMMTLISKITWMALWIRRWTIKPKTNTNTNTNTIPQEKRGMQGMPVQMCMYAMTTTSAVVTTAAPDLVDFMTAVTTIRVPCSTMQSVARVAPEDIEKAEDAEAREKNHLAIFSSICKTLPTGLHQWEERQLLQLEQR